MTIHGDKIVSHAQFKCHTVPRISVGPKMADIENSHMHEEQGVRGKDRILQVNLMKESVVRNGNNGTIFSLRLPPSQPN